MCPGIVKTDLPRHYKAKSFGFVIGVAIFHFLFGKSASNGARTYMAAVTTDESGNGKFIQFYKGEKDLKTLSERVTTSEAGLQMQTHIWEEIGRELVAKVPETKDLFLVV
ncbi:hypothetical protein BX600DRAFT_451359 [Xylariales sp. PMI_506]|nr:hypothetical protein BX600DRAFT_451359 [Xylariales sp. PMI_506]